MDLSEDEPLLFRDKALVFLITSGGLGFWFLVLMMLAGAIIQALWPLPPGSTRP